MTAADKTQEIRFGIMCRGTVFHAWQADAIMKLLSLEKVSCGLLIIDDNPPAYGKKKGKHLFWYAFNRVSKKLTRSFRQVNLSIQLERVPTISCQTIGTKKFSQQFRDTDIEKIRETDLHFILRFGFGIIRGGILDAAKYGIWSFHHDDEQVYRGGPPAFWEIYKDDKITGAILQRLTDKLDAGVVLKKGFVKTKYSYAKNRDQIYKETSRWPAMLCIDILNGHTDRFLAKPSGTMAPVYHHPRNWQLLVYLFKLVYYRLREISRSFFFTDYWNIGVAKAPISAFLDAEKPEVDWYPLRSRNRFLADPFCVVDESDKQKLHIFYETYPFKEARGKLDYVLYNMSFGPEQKLIREPFHLSYPYPIKHKGDYYLVPESYEADSVFMYKAVNFPLSWEKSRILLDGFAGIDNTIIKHDNIYWMFTADKKDGFRYNLKLFYAEDLLAEWMPHPKNPVKTDIRSARSAGTPFRYKGDWYRPSMDYAEKIEGRIYINKVLTLSKTEYEEIPVKIIDPYTDNRFSDKIHTLCDAGEYTIVDGGKEAFIFGSMYFMLHKVILVFKKLKKQQR
jgi:hypothetical protein